MDAQYYTCIEHKIDYMTLDGVVEHLRASHTQLIKRAGALGVQDSHGHMWYCFICDTDPFKDHRSYNSHTAMWTHLRDKHSSILGSIVRLNHELQLVGDELA
ncbi:hypothetical protein EMCG_08049 [[Emmonsia] crescens]|uniref:Uncharacterized protein n=1 Tax=[Emmonsia] crescens TaxID=73230 RepID=A0A0G2I6W3_9EURO|nr:hypothetical protein EMCG_08049 [Emmonsia crescens UAMH 3008]